jgi:hypothetical protein
MYDDESLYMPSALMDDRTVEAGIKKGGQNREYNLSRELCGFGMFDG